MAIESAAEREAAEGGRTAAKGDAAPECISASRDASK